MSLNQYKVYFVLFILMISSWWLAKLFTEQAVNKISVTQHSPDYFSVGYTKKEMDEKGLIKSELKADKMIHYSDDGTTHLTHPLMTLHNQDLPPWVIQAERGILAADGEHLLLTGQVFIRREKTESLRPFEINTSELHVTLSTHYAETDQWAEIIEHPNRTEGIGMELTFIDPIHLKFLSNVKGRYELH